MTFRRSLYFSFAAHILVFGCAIAIANYGQGTISSLSRVIQVSLISSDPGPGHEEGTVSRLQRREHLMPSQNRELSNKPPHKEQSGSPQAPEPTPEYHNDIPEYMLGNPVASSSTLETNDTIVNGIGHTEGGGRVTASVGPGPDSGVETGFGLIAPEQWSLIIAAIERTKNYPRLARERGIEGEVRLRFKINPEGGVEKIEIIESSGSEILDNASVRAVYRAAPMPAVSGWIEMPMKYVLK